MVVDRNGTTIAVADDLLLVGNVEQIVGNQVVVSLDQGQPLRVYGPDTIRAAALTGAFLPLAGGTMVGNIDMGANNIVTAGLVDGVDVAAHVADATIHFTAASLSSTYLPLAGGTMAGTLTMGSNNIVTSGLVDGVDVSTHAADATIHFTAASLSTLYLPLAGGTMTGALLLPDGAVGTPALTFSGDTNTGIYRVGADSAALVAGGALKCGWNATGVGVGASPSYLLDVKGTGDVRVLAVDGTTLTASLGSTTPTASEMLNLVAGTIDGITCQLTTASAKWALKMTTANQTSGSGLATVGATGAGSQILLRQGATVVVRLYSDGTTSYINNPFVVGATSMNSSAIFEVTSTTKGLLLPRMTTTQRDAISTPAAGLTIYNTTTTKLECYNGTTWNAAW